MNLSTITTGAAGHSAPRRHAMRLSTRHLGHRQAAPKEIPNPAPPEIQPELPPEVPRDPPPAEMPPGLPQEMPPAAPPAEIPPEMPPEVPPEGTTGMGLAAWKRAGPCSQPAR